MPWTRSKKLWILAIILIPLALGGLVYSRRPGTPKLRYETAVLDRGRIVARVTATGTLSALVTVQVGSQVSGRIQQLFVDYNSPVRKGELIAKIDPQLFAASLAQAKANYLAAQGNLLKAKVQARQAAVDFGRQADLAKRKLIAPADYDLAKSNWEAAKAQVEVSRGSLAQAKAALNQARVNLAYTNIVSPTDGVVISRNVDVGQTVAASLSAPTLFVIAQDLRRMQVDTNVAEADVGRLREGMAASFTVDAFPGLRFQGKVRQIRNAAETVQNVVTYDAVIDVDNSDLELRPGMTANVSFVVADREDVLRVPNAALRFRPDVEILAALEHPPKSRNTRLGAGTTSSPLRTSEAELDQRTVWVLSGGIAHPVRIKVGVTDGATTEVLAGPLSAGDLVVTDATLGNDGGGSLPGPRRSGAPRHGLF